MPQAQAQQPPYLQPKVGRLPADRPLIRLSISLIDTYKQINTIYYEERDARRAARAKEKAKNKATSSQATPSASAVATTGQQGTNNSGWDDEHYDYIVTPGELFYGRYRIKERIGKGSFGQVVRAEDTQEGHDVAIKIIKSKKPFLMQAKTEIELLTHLNEKDRDDQHNIGTLPCIHASLNRTFANHPSDRLGSFLTMSFFLNCQLFVQFVSLLISCTEIINALSLKCYR